MTKKQLQKENAELRNELAVYQQNAALWRQKEARYTAVITQYMQSRQDVFNLLKQAENALRNEYIDMAKGGDVNAATEKAERDGT